MKPQPITTYNPSFGILKEYKKYLIGTITPENKKGNKPTDKANR